eukprot:m.307744 g.307744  ORF g.307744 m.307744 type:complete len:65 (+) comp42753_c0_seq1:77-271(+)
MTRGNQRELARLKNTKKGAGGGKSAEHGGNKGMTLTERKERDAEKLREKQKLADEKKKPTAGKQ